MILVENKHDILKRLKDLTIINQLVDTHFVENKNGEIEVSKVVKEYDSVRTISEVIKYKLKSHRIQHKKNKDGLDIIISDISCGQTINKDEKICQCISKNINQIFISELKSFKQTQKYSFKYFSQNWIQKLLFKKTEFDLIDVIIQVGENTSWMIVPEFILDVIRDSEWFVENQVEATSIIHKVGKLSNIDIFLNPNQIDSFVYYGNYDSIMLLVDKNIEEKEVKSSGFETESKAYTVNYLFIETGQTKILEII